MPERYAGLFILVSGYVALSRLAAYSSAPIPAHATATFLMMMVIYRQSRQINVGFSFWLKGSFAAALVVLIINVGILSGLSVFLILVFFAVRIGKNLIEGEQ